MVRLFEAGLKEEINLVLYWFTIAPMPRMLGSPDREAILVRASKRRILAWYIVVSPALPLAFNSDMRPATEVLFPKKVLTDALKAASSTGQYQAEPTGQYRTRNGKERGQKRRRREI